MHVTLWLEVWFQQRPVDAAACVSVAPLVSLQRAALCLCGCPLLAEQTVVFSEQRRAGSDVRIRADPPPQVRHPPRFDV